ncbi:MAG: LpxD N-terminal domain-containing protein, partial [Woeseiaceae bacterium]|nr:LpxD N-terminal domain-containing protein [Woeseiaceae bacterium]
MPVSLGQLATRFGCELVGDPDVVVDDVASLPNAREGSISFLSSAAYLEQLASTKAAAVILRDEHVADSATAAARDKRRWKGRIWIPPGRWGETRRRRRR